MPVVEGPRGPLDEKRIHTRDERMGANRAWASVKTAPGKHYLYRNVKLAFPDTGKNMMIHDRVIPKADITGIEDHSPWRLRIYQNAGQNKRNAMRFSNANKLLYQSPVSQKEASYLAQVPKRIPANTSYFQASTTEVDDHFEPNNSMEQATNLISSENEWLANIGDEGVQWDQDWYKIQISSHYRQLIVDLRFQHYLGDIDLKLYDQHGTLIAGSQGPQDDEFLNLVLEKAGVYYLQVSGSNQGNHYDLKYSTGFTGGGDDDYEENDRLQGAYDLRAFSGQWLSSIKGEAVAADDDFYRIKVPSGKLRVIVDLRVDAEKGDVDVKLLNAQGALVASSSSIGDDDYIDFKVPSAGDYYLKVYPFHTVTHFNMYDLKWTVYGPKDPAPDTYQKEVSNSLSKPTESKSEAAR